MEITCLNDNPCCNLWAKNTGCHNNTEYMRMNCRKSCGYCRSTDNKQNGNESIFLVQIKNSLKFPSINVNIWISTF